MSYILKYIGPTQTFKAIPLHDSKNLELIDIFLEENKEYQVELQPDGQVMIFNDQVTMPGIWIIFPSLGGCIGYSSEAILKQWKMIRKT